MSNRNLANTCRIPSFGNRGGALGVLLVLVAVLAWQGVSLAQSDICGCKSNPTNLGAFDTATATYPPGITRSGSSVTISLPPELLDKAERVARAENRTRSELVREALRFYVETSAVRRQAARERLFEVIGRAQARAARTPRAEVRKIVREAVAVARRTRSPSTA